LHLAPPIAPGETFVYARCPGRRTVWYPHQRCFEQVGRSLYGALIVGSGPVQSIAADLGATIGG
jgi:FtsP/CotA-like multicopper oxidase with cupredoxin domain